jgi:uncharacterized protein (DUF362 family)
MKRRDFLRLAGAAGAGVLVPSGLVPLAGAADGGKPGLAVARGASPAKIARAAVDALGGMARFIKKGETVVVKPNMAWDRRPEYAANTNPEVVAEVVRMCLEAGAKRVKVFDRPVNDPRRCYVQSGIKEAALAAGAEVPFMDGRRYKKTRIPGGKAITRWPLYTEVLEADALINVPVAKHHGLGGLTMAMKNWMGVMGGRRNMIHQRLDESLADLARVIRPRLTVLDAVRILTANGPQGGSLEDVKRLDTIIAGVDQVAVDSYGATLFGMKGSDLGYIREAVREGLGVGDLSKVQTIEVSLQGSLR